MGDTGKLQRISQIFQIILIGYSSGHNLGADLGIEAPSVVQLSEVAGFVVAFAIIEIFMIEDPRALPVKIAKFGLQLRAAFAHESRRKRGIHVRSDVPVPRQM